MNQKKHGGHRPGAGRPKAKDLRKSRGLNFSDQEWEIIKKIAAREGMSAREYISWLVSQDKNRLRDEPEVLEDKD